MQFSFDHFQSANQRLHTFMSTSQRKKLWQLKSIAYYITLQWVILKAFHLLKHHPTRTYAACFKNLVGLHSSQQCTLIPGGASGDQSHRVNKCNLFTSESAEHAQWESLVSPSTCQLRDTCKRRETYCSSPFSACLLLKSKFSLQFESQDQSCHLQTLTILTTSRKQGLSSAGLLNIFEHQIGN